jgi:hypothetical protein
MGKQASLNLERIVYNRGQRKATPTAPGHTELKRDCHQRSGMIQTAQTIYPEKSGSVLGKRVEDNIPRSILWIKIYWH